MNTQYTEKELTGIIAQESAIKITDEKEQIKTAILDDVRELEYEDTSTDKEAKFAIDILFDEYFIRCTGRIAINGIFIHGDNENPSSFCELSRSLYDFDIMLVGEHPIAFTINGKTQYDFRDELEVEIERM